MASNAGDVPTTYEISLHLVPLSNEDVMILECPCHWCTWRAAILEEILCMLYDVEVEPMTLTVD
jgi:hypothetical protein